MSTGAYANSYIAFTVIAYEFLTLIFYILLFIPFVVDLHLSKLKMSRKTINLVFFAIIFNAMLNIPPTVKAIKEYIMKKAHHHRDIRYSVQIPIQIHPPI